VECPLPPPSLLERSHEELLQRQGQLRDQCQTELTGLFDRFSTGPELEIPARVIERASQERKDFEAAAEKAEQRAELVSKQLEMWAELKELLPRLFKWLRGALSELSCLRKIPDFATEFSSLQSRLEDLRDQVEENTAPVQRLQQLATDHLSPDEPATQKITEKFSRVEENWRALNEGVESLVVAMAPWKELTDQFDELQDWFDQFRDQVRRDLSDLEQEDDNSANMSDYIVALKDHLLKMDQRAEALEKLTNQRADLLSLSICSKHDPAHDLREQISELEDMWVGEEQLLRHSLSDVEEKEAEWKRLAVSSIRQASLLSLDLASRNTSLSDKEREIERQRAEIAELQRRLKQAPPTATPLRQESSISSCFKVLFVLLVSLLLLAVALALFFHDTGSHLDLSPLVFHLSTPPFKPI
jgi:chromosome segregation ATPase